MQRNPIFFRYFRGSGVRETGLSPPAKYFTDCSKVVLLLWIFYVFCFFFCLVFVMPLHASVYLCLVVTCWEKGWPLGSRLWCLTVSLSLSHWYHGSGVVLDCIDSWSLLRYLLCSLAYRGLTVVFHLLRYNIVVYTVESLSLFYLILYLDLYLLRDDTSRS